MSFPRAQESPHEYIDPNSARSFYKFCGVHRCIFGCFKGSPYVGWTTYFLQVRKLKTHELNYPTHDLELLVVVHALVRW